MPAVAVVNPVCLVGRLRVNRAVVRRVQVAAARVAVTVALAQAAATVVRAIVRVLAAAANQQVAPVKVRQVAPVVSLICGGLVTGRRSITVKLIWAIIEKLIGRAIFSWARSLSSQAHRSSTNTTTQGIR